MSDFKQIREKLKDEIVEIGNSLDIDKDQVLKQISVENKLSEGIKNEAKKFYFQYAQLHGVRDS